jgi:lipid A 3-O-deacylase PagL
VTIIRIGLALFLVLVILFGGATTHLSYAAQGNGEPAPVRAPVASDSSRPPPRELPFQKGTVEIGAIGGTALPISLFRARTNRRLTMASLQIGRVMTNQTGPGVLAGHFELLLEITPLIHLRQPETVFGLAMSPVFFRWTFGPSVRRRMRWFGEVSGGILYTSQPVPVRTTAFNFIDQAGFGVRVEPGPNRAWLMGYRFQHVSNGGRVRPNPGANFNFVYGGISWLR